MTIGNELRRIGLPACILSLHIMSAAPTSQEALARNEAIWRQCYRYLLPR